MNTIIEKIRAEVERMNAIAKADVVKNTGEMKVWNRGIVTAYSYVLSILSDLEKECEEKPTNIDFEQELYKHFGQVKDFTLGLQIGKYFYELGCRCTAEKYDEIEYNRQRASGSLEIPNDLEGAAHEAATYHFQDGRSVEDMERYFGFVHGAQWQKEQMMKGAVEGIAVINANAKEDGFGYVRSDYMPDDVLRGLGNFKLIIVKED